MQLNKLLGQRHLVDGAALHGRLNKQIAGHLHLAEHAHLWIGGLTMLRSEFGKRSSIIRGIGYAPNHTIDSELLQHGSTGVVGLLMPAGGGVMKQPFDAFVPKLLASLQESAGGQQRGARQAARYRAD